LDDTEPAPTQENEEIINEQEMEQQVEEFRKRLESTLQGQKKKMKPNISLDWLT
jgi:hypothetical protein